VVALQSRRIESLLGTKLDQIRAAHIHALVDIAAQEAFDLDFKATLYGRSDSDRRALAGDVAALANTGGGIVVLGVDEDGQARAVAAPGIELSDAEIARIRQVVASLAAPMPVFDVLGVPETSVVEGNEVAPPGWSEPPTRGFIVIAVPRSPAAPHAVLVNEALRFPKRNGATTRYLSEPEVATAYRDRFAGAARQAARVAEVEGEAVARLDTTDLPWVLISLVPDLPGDFAISREVYLEFQRQAIGKPAAILDTGTTCQRVNVGRRRLLVDGASGSTPLARWMSAELHSDGAGTYALQVADLAEQRRRQLPPEDGAPRPQLVDDESIAVALLSGILHSARHARDRAAAGGSALVRAQLLPISEARPTEIGHSRSFSDSRSRYPLIDNPPAAEAAASLDDLAEPGPVLVSVAAALADEIGQAFGVPEMGQLSRDGEVRRRYWGHGWQQRIVAWAEQHNIPVSDATLQ